MKIQTKLFVVYMIAVVLLLGSLTLFLTKRSADLLFGTITQNMTQTLAQIASNLDNKMQSYEETAHSFYLNVMLQEMLTERYSDVPSAYRAYFDLLEPYLSIIQGPRNVYRVRFYSDNPTLAFANVIRLDEEIRRENWYRELSGKPTGLFWTHAYRIPTSEERVFSVRQKLGNLYPDAELYVSLEIREQEFYQLIDKESGGKRILLAGPDGKILLDSADRNYTADRLDGMPFAGAIGEGEGHSPYRDDSGDYLVLYRDLADRSPVRGMRVVMLVPLDELMPQIERMRWLAYLMLAVSCALAAFLVYILSVGLMRRLSGLAKGMRRVHLDRYRGLIDVKGNDEVSQLGRIFNEMVEQLERLIHEVYQAEIDRKELALRTREAELFALQAQINPHYLFNVLNMLRANLLDRDDRKNAEIVHMLAKSFRFLMQNKSETIPFRQELELVSTYLTIQKLRFEDRLQYRIEVSEEALEVELPKLCLQPLVENAIKHGMEMNNSTTTIVVRMQPQPGRDGWRATVEDDGCGVSPERLAEIREWLREDQSVLQGDHIGLRNIHYRLVKRYGPESGLLIDSGQGFTRISFLLPAGERQK